MSTATQRQPQPQRQTEQQPQKTVLDQAIERTVTYVPLGESDEIKLSAGMVKAYLCSPTKSGALPTDRDCMKFVMLCKTRQLNPWAGEAYIIGYDTKDGPQFALVVSIHALHKRAERCPAYDGIEAGVVVIRDGQIVERAGDLVLQGERLVGGWCKVYRKDRRVPFYRSVKLEAYAKGNRQWQGDGPGMIRKCAQAAVLREAFPNEVSGLTSADEVASDHEYVPVGLPANLRTAVEETERRREQDYTQTLNQDPSDQAAAAIDRDLSADPVTAAGDWREIATARLNRCHNPADVDSAAADLAGGFQFAPGSDADKELAAMVEARKAIVASKGGDK